MARTLIIAATSTFFALQLTAFAQQGQLGTADEAKAMLTRRSRP